MDKPKRPGKNAGPNAWDRFHTDMAAWKQQEGRSQNYAAQVAGTVIATAYGVAQAVTATGVGDFQPGQGGTFDGNWAESSLQSQQDRRSRELDEGTRDDGYSTGWSGQGY